MFDLDQIFPNGKKPSVPEWWDNTDYEDEED